MKTYPQTLAAGQTAKFEGGRYFEILESASAVTVQFIRGGSLGEKAADVLSGYYATPATPFDAVLVTSPAAQNIVVAISDGSGGYRRISGNVSVTPPGQATALTDVVVLAAAGALVSAANSLKRETLVTNLSANTAVMRVGGLATMTAAVGIEIGPGQTATIDGNAAVYVWNTGAGSQSVGVVEIST